MEKETKWHRLPCHMLISYIYITLIRIYPSSLYFYLP